MAGYVQGIYKLTGKTVTGRSFCKLTDEYQQAVNAPYAMLFNLYGIRAKYITVWLNSSDTIIKHFNFEVTP